MIMMIFVGWFCFTRNEKLQIRGLLSYLLSWTLLGNYLAYWIASVGPCFYRPFYGVGRFDGLMQKLHDTNQTHELFAFHAMNYLANTYKQDKVGAGISAMPSLHVGIAFLCFFAICSYTKKLSLKLVAGAYALIIWIGSVHLGWHYASDGLVSAIGVGLIWWATGKFVDWLEARDQARAGRAPSSAINSLPASA